MCGRAAIFKAPAKVLPQRRTVWPSLIGYGIALDQFYYQLTDAFMISLLDQMVEALRNELQQYGEMLALMDQQQQAVRRHRAEAIWESISEMNTQSGIILSARELRQNAQRSLAEALNQPADATFVQLLPALPEHYQPLVNALVQENNQLLLRVREKAHQNQVLLRRSLELMQQFIVTLADNGTANNGSEGVNNVLAIEPASSLYAAIV